MDIENEGESLFEEHLDLDTINEKLKKDKFSKENFSLTELT